MRNVYLAGGVCLWLWMTGCANRTEANFPGEESRHQTYKTVHIDQAPPKAKEEHWIEPTTKEEIEAYQKEQEKLSDFEKMMRYRKRK